MFEAPTLDTLIQYNLGVALPAIFLAFWTMVVLMADLFIDDERSVRITPILALSGIAASFIMTLFTYNTPQPEAFDGMFRADAFTNFANIVVLATAFFAVLISYDYLHRTNIEHGEYYTLLLLSTTGVMFMAGANDLIIVFIALELLSIPLYVLSAFHATGATSLQDVIFKSEESGMKYFILGAFASAFLVYGSALVYGATGSTNLQEIFVAVPEILAADGATGTFLMLTGAALILVGLGFKVAVVPFHMWTPDVYQGAPTPVTAFMSVAAKVGGFTALLRVMIIGLSAFALSEGQAAAWQNTVQVIAILTLILGNFAALAQSNIKRLLAYSSIAHAGYILMAVAAVGSETFVPGVANSAAQAALVYLMAYMFTNLGAFAVVMALEYEQGKEIMLDDFNGLYNSRPWLAMAMALFMFSLTGIPLTAGFLGKWLVFGAAVQSGLILLVVIGVLTSVVSAFYYIRVVVNMYLNTESAGDEAAAMTTPLQVAIYAAAAGVLLLGILAPLATNLVNMVHLV